MKTLLFIPVIQNYVEASGHCNDQLVQSFMCVSAPFRAARNIVQIINALNTKGICLPLSMNVRLPRGSVILGSSIILQFLRLI